MAVEFALVLPLILLVLFSIIEFGQAFNHLNQLNQIAGNGARFAAVDHNPGGGSLQSFLEDSAELKRLEDAIEVCIDFPAGGTEVGDPVEVTATSVFALIPLIGDAAGGLANITLKGRATMRIERPPTYAAGC